MKPNEFQHTALIIPPRCRAVLCTWAAIPGLVCAPFVFWQSLFAGCLFCLLWAALVYGVWVRCISFVASLGPLCLTVQAGVGFPVLRQLPRCSVTGVHLLRTPLLWLAGGSVMLVHSPGVNVLLPGVPAQQAAALAALLTEELP